MKTLLLLVLVAWMILAQSTNSNTSVRSGGLPFAPNFLTLEKAGQRPPLRTNFFVRFGGKEWLFNALQFDDETVFSYLENSTNKIRFADNSNPSLLWHPHGLGPTSISLVTNLTFEAKGGDVVVRTNRSIRILGNGKTNLVNINMIGEERVSTK